MSGERNGDRHPAITRRQFLGATAATAAGAALTGCAINPVTGEKQFMLFSEADEVRLDQQNSPHQFSADYGAVQDPRVNQYVAGVGQAIAPHTHRPQMPYNYRCVNASYVNAYTFPAGSMATTRGMLLAMDNEAELAALLGHEIGHVNARHTATAMSRNLLIQGVLAGAGMALDGSQSDYAPLILGLGALGSGLLTARYSRENERQADALGMEYMVRAGYNPQGMIGVMDVLRKLHSGQPNVIEQMLASHPMSEERYQTATARAASSYAAARSLPLHRDRYMDTTAPVRRFRGVVQAIQKGDTEMRGKRYGQAEGHYAAALRQAGGDYEALLKMAKCKVAQRRPADAHAFASRARSVYPQEAQARHVCGYANLALKRYDAALADFQAYESILPGNPNIVFYTGFALEGMNRRPQAAEHYTTFLNRISSGDEATHARTRLIQWGYLKPPEQSSDEQKKKKKK